MKTLKLILSIFTFIILSGSIFGQDTIYKRTQEVIDCKIKEVGTESIKYALPGYPEDVLFAIDNDKILKVIFEDGQEIEFMNELLNPENYIDNNKNAIKIDFTSPLTGNTTFAYEHSMKPGRSVETSLGIIGLGFKVNDRQSRGAFVRVGYKFIKSPDFYFSKMRYSHILKGAYVKPEVSFGYYNEKFDYYNYDTQSPYTETEDNFSFAIHLVLGKQWIMDNAFLIDFFGGIGYGFNSGDPGYHYGYVIADSSFPISATAGLKIGFLFK